MSNCRYTAAHQIISNKYYSINITNCPTKLLPLKTALKTGLDSIFPVYEVIYLSTTAEHCNVVLDVCFYYLKKLLR